ncbi:hypothetical protein [Streptomyces hokutonensis]|uniref:hypothetical protein n=1 Tax=Streptomyces hokutonensis TaxID=1306990 RepID=UPI0036C3AEFD
MFDLSGLGLLHASLFTDLCLRHVRPRVRPVPVVSGFLLILLGIAEAWSRPKAGADGETTQATTTPDPPKGMWAQPLQGAPSRLAALPHACAAGPEGDHHGPHRPDDRFRHARQRKHLLGPDPHHDPCRAADAQSIKVRVHRIPALAANTWVPITGTWHAGGTLGTSSAPAALDGVTVEKVAKPVNAYQDAFPFPTSR